MIGAAIEVTKILRGQKAGGIEPYALLDLYKDEQIIHMFPSLDFDEQRRFRKGTQAAEVIDYFSQFHV
ncbi:hypothetical protein Q671_04840 [Halomonas sp. PBN3]|nr:hypothetical protein Q671_04840 [Halomonas sp. PBN3]